MSFENPIVKLFINPEDRKRHEDIVVDLEKKLWEMNEGHAYFRQGDSIGPMSFANSNEEVGTQFSPWKSDSSIIKIEGKVVGSFEAKTKIVPKALREQDAADRTRLFKNDQLGFDLEKAGYQVIVEYDYLNSDGEVDITKYYLYEKKTE